MDALLIAAAQKVEHYEIATYGTLCTWAEALGYTKRSEAAQAEHRPRGGRRQEAFADRRNGERRCGRSGGCLAMDR